MSGLTESMRTCGWPQSVRLEFGVSRDVHLQKRLILTLEVPEIVVGSLGLRNCIVWLRLSSVDHIRELQGVLNEEDGNVVSVNALALIPGRSPLTCTRHTYPTMSQLPSSV